MLKFLKDKLGEECTFLSYSLEKIKNIEGKFETKNTIKCILKNTDGTKDTIRTILDKPLSTEDLENLYYNYKNRTYDRSGNSI